MESMMYTHLHPNTPPSVLNGRKLASMRSGRVGVVPIQARDGDVVVYLAGIPVSVVLRPRASAGLEDLNKKIYEAFWGSHDDILDLKSLYWESFMDVIQMKRGTIKYMALIGECYVEGVIGWSFKNRHEHHNFDIYSLH